MATKVKPTATALLWPEYMSRETAARYADVSVAEIDRARQIGDLYCHYRGRKPLFPRKELDAWIQALPVEKK